MAFAKTLKEQKLNIFCDFCFRNITTETYFRCEDCSFDSCIVCFSSRVETDIHRNTHKFRTISNLEKVVTDDGWRMIDELLLLDGLISYGFGNFDDISKILPEKDESKVRKHFFELVGIKDNVDGEVSCAIVSKSNPNDSIIASFMSKRKEFDSEILNEYESLLENLVFEEDDSSTDTDLKRHLLENYRIVLKRRSIWRSFIFDRNLTDIEYFRSKEKTDVYEIGTKYRWLLQFLSKRDFNVFIAGIVREKRLKETLIKNSAFSVVDLEKLNDNSNLLSTDERIFCRKLSIEPNLYIKIKRFALERYIGKQPLKQHLFDLFHHEDIERVHIVYQWFLKQGIVCE